MITDLILDNWKYKLIFGFIVLFVGIASSLFIGFIANQTPYIGIICIGLGWYWIEDALFDKPMSDKEYNKLIYGDV